MEGIEEGGAQDQVSDADTLEQLCTSLQVGGGASPCCMIRAQQLWC
jgi:hypothetical protein